MKPAFLAIAIILKCPRRLGATRGYGDKRYGGDLPGDRDLKIQGYGACARGSPKVQAQGYVLYAEPTVILLSADCESQDRIL